MATRGSRYSGISKGTEVGHGPARLQTAITEIKSSEQVAGDGPQKERDQMEEGTYTMNGPYQGVCSQVENNEIDFKWVGRGGRW